MALSVYRNNGILLSQYKENYKKVLHYKMYYSQVFTVLHDHQNKQTTTA